MPTTSGWNISEPENATDRNRWVDCYEHGWDIELIAHRALQSDQFIAAGDTKLLHHPAHVLRVFAMRNQQRILGIHDHQVFDADERYKFLGAIDVVVAGLDSDMAVGL